MQFSAWKHAHPLKHEFVLWPGITNDLTFAKGVENDFIYKVKEFADSPLAKESGFTGYGRILNYPGYPSSPYSFPNIDNKLGDVEMHPEFVEDLKVSFDVLYHDYATKVCDRPITLRRGANSGLPSFTRDMTTKVEELDKVFNDLGSFGALILKNDWTQLRKLFGVVPAATLGSRTQTDAVELVWKGGTYKAIPKEREAIVSWDPVTNAQERVIIDKSLARFGMETKLVSMRHRTIYAIPSLLNIPLMPIGNAMFDCAVRQFPYTFDAGDIFEFVRRQDIRKHFRKRKQISFDFKEFDHSVPDEALWLYCQLMQTVGVPKWASKLAYDVTHLPCIMNGTTLDGSDNPPHIFGSLTQWFLPQWMIHFGLPSGWVFTSNFPKWFVTTLIYHVLWRVCKVIPRSKDSYVAMLGWREDAPVHDMCGGDDNALSVLPNVFERVYDTFCRGVTDTVPTMKVSWDETTQFLSHIFTKDANGDVAAYPDLARGFTNSFCPAESAFPSVYRNAKPSYNTDSLFRYYGITGKADPDVLKGGTTVPGYGWMKKDELYTQRSPGWTALRDLMFDFLKKFNPHIIDNLRQIADVEATLLARLKVDSTNVADLDILNNPEKVFYRHSRDSISDSVYTLFYASYGEDRLAKLKPYYVA